MLQSKQAYYTRSQANLALLVLVFGYVLIDAGSLIFYIAGAGSLSVNASILMLMALNIPVIILALSVAKPVPALSWHRTRACNLVYAGLLALFSYIAASILIDFLAGMLVSSGGDIPDNVVVDEVVQGPFIVSILFFCVMAPFTEEILFRGMVQNAYERRFGMAAVVISAAIFGLMHADLLLSINAFLMGLVAGYLFLQTRSLWTAIVFHAVFNFLGFTRLPDLFLIRLPWVLGAFPMESLTFSNGPAALYFALIAAAAVLVIFVLLRALKCANLQNQTARVPLWQNEKGPGTILFLVLALYLMGLRLFIGSSAYFPELFSGLFG